MPDNMSLLGGFLRGSAQAKMMGPKREQEKELNALKKQMIQLQLSNAKIKQQELKMKGDLMQRFFQKGDEQKQASQATQPSDDFDPLSRGAGGATESVDKSKLIESLAGGGMSPEQMAMMKWAGGPDFIPAGRLDAQVGNLEERKRQNLITNLFKEKQFERESGQFIGEETTGPGGVITKRFRPKYGAPPSFIKQTKKPKGAEGAGKIATIRSALQNMPYIKKSFINKDGSVNRQNVFNANMPGGGTPWSEGRQLRASYLEGLDAKIRAMTGAAINKEEIPYYDAQFYPSVFDTDAGIKDKIRRMERFLKGFLSEMAPGEPVNPKDVINIGGKQYKIESKEELPKPKTQAEFNALPSGTIYIDPDDGKEYRKP